MKRYLLISMLLLGSLSFAKDASRKPANSDPCVGTAERQAEATASAVHQHSQKCVAILPVNTLGDGQYEVRVACGGMEPVTYTVEAKQEGQLCFAKGANPK